MKKVLQNIKILITRSFNESKEVISFLELTGAEVVPFPAIKISPVDNFSRFDEEMKNLSKYEYLVFTSANACRIFSQRLKELNLVPDFSNTIVITTGTKTAEVCKAVGILPNIIPDEFSAEGVTRTLAELDLHNKNVFIPSSELARSELKNNLTELGAIITQVPIYKVTVTTKQELNDQINSITELKPDLFAFTSPSNFKNFLTIMKIENPVEYFSESSVAAIGKTTEKEINSFNVNVDLVPDSFTLDSLVDSIIEKYK